MPFKNIITQQVIVGGGDSSEVEQEQLRYDNLNVANKATENVSAIVETTDTSKKAVDTTEVAFAAVLDELSKEAVETTQLEANLDTEEKSKESIETITVDVEVLTELAKKASDIAEVEATVNAFAFSAQNEGWENPNNALGNTANTAATLSASSSGLRGGTSNTTSGDIVLDFKDINIGDLTLDVASARIEIERTDAGLLSRPTSNIEFQISLDSGSSFTTFYVLNTEIGRSIIVLDLLSLILGDTTKLSQILLRAVGTVTSGTGLGASTTASIFRKVIIVTADKEYT